MSPRKQVTYSSNPNRAARHAHARAAQQFKTYDTSYIQPKRSKTPFLVIVVVLIALLIISIGVVRGCMQGSSRPLVEAGVEVSITIEEGASANSIGKLLEENGLVSRASEFTDEVNRAGVAAELKPGNYIFEGGTSTADLVRQICAGPENDAVTIPEGLTGRATARLIDQATGGRISESQMMSRINNAAEYEADYDFVSEAFDNSLEGFLFPKTYEIGPDDDADSVVRKMLDQYQEEVSTLDYAYAESKNLTPYDILILASVIERESAADVRSEVSSVFYNRMSGGIPLQSDATVAYLVDGDPTPEDIENTQESPYNTYYNYGLPAGPICSPSLESLKAACAPAQTDYLYFFFEPDADGNMQYYFSVDYDEHLNAINGLGTALDIGGSSKAAANDEHAADGAAEGDAAQGDAADGAQADQG